MKNVLSSILLLLSGFTATAHDHIETRLNPQNPNQLSVFGNFMQTATFFPLGEAPSLALQNLPGGAYASELTFSAFDNSAPPPLGALIRVDVLSVTETPRRTAAVRRVLRLRTWHGSARWDRVLSPAAAREQCSERGLCGGR